MRLAVPAYRVCALPNNQRSGADKAVSVLRRSYRVIFLA